MTQNEFIKAYAFNTGLSVDICRKLLQAFILTLKQSLLIYGSVKLRGFGTLYLKYTDAYWRRNRFTKEKELMPPRYHVKFKAGKDLREEVNEEFM